MKLPKVATLVLLSVFGVSAVVAATDDTDAKVFKLLEENGTDLSRTHRVDFFLLFSQMENAARACDTLATEGYESHLSASNNTFTCQAARAMVLDLADMQARRARFDRLAAEFSGKYDGWGAVVQP